MPSKLPIHVLSLDPGETVGWSTARIFDLVTAPDLAIEDYGNLRMKQAGLGLEDPDHVLNVRRYDIVIFETWILTSKGARDAIGSEMESSQFIGMVRAAVWRTKGKTKLERSLPKRKTDALMYLRNDRPDYAAIQAIIDAAPKRHDDAHYVDALLHTVAYFHKEFL